MEATDQLQQQQQGSKERKTKRSIIDCDIHAGSFSDEVMDYLPRVYREQIKTFGWRLPSQNAMYLNGTGKGVKQDESFPKEGGSASYLKYFQTNFLEKYNIEYGILTGTGSYSIQTSPDADYAAAVCSAYNNYGIDKLLSQDERIKGSILIPKQDPILSAQEIDRVGSNPDMVQVIVANGAEKPYGNRFYHPIYEACVRNELPFAIHVSMEGIGINPAPTGAGQVSHYIEYRAARAQIMATHLASFIFEGVFEKFPTLKVVMIEAGTLWIAPLLWRLDQDWKALRSQTPWVKEPPSEYYRKHFRVTSQPIELPPKPSMFLPMLEAINADTNLMFATDFPHWDFDSPTLAFPKLDEQLWERIFYQNAAELYGLPQRRSESGAGR
ncbi:amidohydrolase family protein [Paenibacillus sp. GD4]|uniref:amidohydrolase family protein n=1 Tax=Paenibacillus sp. GD4 TaxID=3068890 RepID=UPI002796570C|nr:amidohydrolase family protein [Paenibacillus sp. GD4]MDQ1912677.1 amidohydrolase family protein [Paenibacillus sp. GD4]